MKNQIKFIKLLVILALALAVLGPVSVSAQGGNPPDLKDGGPGGNTGFGAALPSSPDDNCSAGPNLIQYDDGTIDASAGVTTADPASEIVQLFTPPGYPYTITKVCVTWAASVALATHPYEVVIYADTGAGPGAQLAAIPDLAGSVPVNPTTRWYGSAANYTVTSGSVYVGVRWVEASPPDQAVGYDSNGATPNQTIYYRYSAIPWTNATGTVPAMGIRLAGTIPGFTVNPTGPISINENGVAQLRFRITDQPTADVTFPISTDDTSECVIGAGVTSVTFPVATWDSAVLVFVGGVQDMLVDGDQPCNIITGDPTSADASYNVLTAADTPNVATTIVDIDAPGIFVAVSGSTTITEGNTRDLGFWVGTQPTGGADVTFPVSVSDPTQCEIAGGITSMTILNANWNVPAANAITINAFDNDIVDGSRPCNLITGDPTSGDAYYDGLGAADSPDVLITISDEDSAAVRIVPSTIAATEGGANGTFTVVLDSQPVANVTIGLTFATGEAALVDVTPALPFTAADWNVPRTFQIQAVDDAALEGPHTDTITVISSSTDPNYGSAVTYIGGLGAASNEVTVNITDNDMPGIAVNPVALTISEPNETDTFNIALSTMPSDNVSVGLSVSDPSECSVTPASVTIIPSAWTTGANVTVQAVDDAIMDGDQTCTVITAPAVSTDAGYNGVDPANVVVTVLDDETPRDTDEDDDGAGSTGPTAEDVARAQAPLCGDITGATNPIVRASVPGGTVPGGGVYCRVLAESGSYAVPYSAAEIGNMDVINMGVIHAVDVFGMAGSTPVPNWMSSISVCLQGTGRMMLLDATTAPRALSLLSSWQSGGYTCATLYNAGTVVLVP